MQEYTFLPKIGEEAGLLGRGQRPRKGARGRSADHLHAPDVQEGQGARRAHRPRGIGRPRPRRRVISGRQLVRRDQRIRAHPRRKRSVTLRHYLISSGPHRDHRGNADLSPLPQCVRIRILVRRLRPAPAKRVITDTGKTQYLFRINKGVENLGESINEHMPEAERPIPFSDMVYFGDGDADVPSMAVTRKNGGYAVAVHPPGKHRTKCVDLFKAGRCDFFAPADYPARIGPLQAHVPAAPIASWRTFVCRKKCGACAAAPQRPDRARPRDILTVSSAARCSTYPGHVRAGRCAMRYDCG